MTLVEYLSFILLLETVWVILVYVLQNKSIKENYKLNEKVIL